MSRKQYAKQGIYMRYRPANLQEGFFPPLVAASQQTRNTDSLKVISTTNETTKDTKVSDVTKLNKELSDKQLTDTDTTQQVKFNLDASTDTVLSTVSKTTTVDRSVEKTMLDSRNILNNLVMCDINIDTATSIRDKLVIDRSKQLNLNVSQLVAVLGEDNLVENVVLSNIVNSIGDKTKRDCVQNVVNSVEAQNKLLSEQTNIKTGDTLEAGKSRTGAANVDVTRKTTMRAENESKSNFDLADAFKGLSNYVFGTEVEQEAKQTGQVTSTQNSPSTGWCSIL